MTWLQRIEAALEVGEFTQEDKDLSGEWATCAMSERFRGRLYEAKLPHDFVRLGVDFCVAVTQDQPDAAMLLYKKIQENI